MTTQMQRNDQTPDEASQFYRHGNKHHLKVVFFVCLTKSWFNTLNSNFTRRTDKEYYRENSLMMFFLLDNFKLFPFYNLCRVY